MPPALPISAPDLVDASDSGSSQTDNLTKETTLTFTGFVGEDATVSLIENSGIVTSATVAAGPWTLTGSFGEGIHEITAEAIGGNGDWSHISDPLVFTVDTTPPETEITAKPDLVSKDSTAVFDFGPDEDGITFAVTVDGGDRGTFTDGLTLSDLHYAAHTLLVEATDAAGNTDTGAEEWAWVVDTLALSVTAHMAAESDSGASSSDNLTNVKAPQFRGTIESDDSPVVGVYLLEEGTERGSSATGGGTWTIDPSGEFDEGVHTVIVRAKYDDGLGYSATFDSDPLVFTIDTTPPETEITVKPDQVTKDSTAVFDFGPDEDGITFAVTVDGSDKGTFTDGLTLSDLHYAVHTLAVTATDAAGNTDADAEEWSWVVDTLALSVTAHMAAESDSGASSSDNLTNVKAPQFRGTIDADGDPIVGVYLLEGDTQRGSSATGGDTWTIDPFGEFDEGIHTVIVRANYDDGLGYSVTFDSDPIVFTVDATPPETTILDGPDSVVTETTAIFDFGSDEGDVTWVVSVDAGEPSTAGASFTIGDLGHGYHTLSVHAVDGAGNEDASPETHVWAVDLNDLTVGTPYIDASDDSGWSNTDGLTNKSAPTFHGTVVDGDGFGFHAPQVDLVEGDSIVGSGSGGDWTIPGAEFGDGAHVVFARVTDEFGRTFDSDALTFTIDTAAPDATIVGGPPEYVEDSTASFDFGPVEDGVTFMVSVDDGSYTAVTSPLVLTEMATGRHTLQVYAVDGAGNNDEESPDTLSWTVDLNALTVDRPDLFAEDDNGASDSDDLTNESAPRFQALVKDGEGNEFSTASVVLIEGDSVLTDSGSNGTTIAGASFGEGVHVVFARATDEFGKTFDSDALTFTVDTSAPDTTVIYGPDTLTNETAAVFDFGPDEAGVTFAAKLDGGGYETVSDPLTLTGLADGEHILVVRATDAAGNASTEDFTYAWTVDATPPGVIVVDGPDTLTNESTALFDFGPDEPGITFVARVDDGSYEPVSDPLTLSGLDDGVHTLLLRGNDAAGNADTTDVSWVWTVDATPPDTTILYGPDTLTNEQTAVFDFGAGEEGVTFSVNLDDGGFSEVSDPLTLTGLDEGEHRLLVRATDAAGNVEISDADYVWTIDTTPPDTTVVAGPDLLTNETTATFDFGPDEEGITFAARLDAGGYSQVSDPLVLGDVAEGVHTLLVHATDAAGNIDETDFTYVWTVAASPPETTIFDGPDALTNQTTATFDFGPDEAGTTFTVQVDGGGFSGVADPLTLSGLAEGVHTLLVHASDAVGNVDPTDETYVWTVDTTPPDTTVVDGPDALTNTTVATFDFGPTEAGITFAAKLDDGSYSEVFDPLTLAGLGEGVHTLLVHATDAAGNVDTTDFAYVWTIDTTPPDTTVVDGPATLTGDTTATFDFGPSEAGITFSAKLDDGSYSEVSDPLTLSGLDDGAHTLLVRATDAAGNVDTTDFAYVWTVDATAPDTTIIDGPGGLTKETSATFDFGPGEAGITFIAKLDDGSYSEVADPLTLSGLDEGTHTLLVYAKDALGNQDTTPAEYVWTIDATAPETTIVDGPDTLTNETTATFDFGPAEPGVTFSAKLDDGSYSEVSDPLALSGLSEGVHTLLVRANDALGNEDTTPAEHVWTIDTTPPDTTIVAAPSGLVASAAAAVTFTGELDASFEANLDGGGWSAASSPLALAGLGEGAHTLLVRAVDAAGNADATPAAATWTVDTQPPGTTILQGPAAVTNQTTAVFDFGSGDANVTYEVALDGASYTAVSDPATFGGLAEGAHTLLVRAVDAAGNVDATPATRVWTIDTTAPPAPAVTGFADDTGEQGDGLTTDRTLSIHGTGAAGSIAHVLRDGVEIGTATVNGGGDWLFADTATLAFGKHAYTAFATDALANPSGLSDPMTVLVADTKAAAGNGGDLLTGGAGSGSLDGKDGNDTLFGEAGNDTVKGGNGADWLSGGGDQDALWGGAGNDTVSGGNGKDTLYGEAGEDVLSGGEGDDRIEGGAGADSIDGGGGADSLWGGDGTDTIVGGGGTDRIFGDAGGDWIVLGLDGAKDSVIGSVAHLSGDTLVGFETGKGGDAIVFSGLAATSGKFLDSLAIVGGVLSLSKIGGGTIVFDDPDVAGYTDTVLGSDGSILLYVV